MGRSSHTRRLLTSGKGTLDISFSGCERKPPKTHQAAVRIEPVVTYSAERYANTELNISHELHWAHRLHVVFRTRRLHVAFTDHSDRPPIGVQEKE